jgi:hypothetical protein
MLRSGADEGAVSAGRVLFSGAGGIWEFHHLERLPEQLEGSLPTIEALEAELASPETPSAVRRRGTAPDPR